MVVTVTWAAWCGILTAGDQATRPTGMVTAGPAVDARADEPHGPMGLGSGVLTLPTRATLLLRRPRCVRHLALLVPGHARLRLP